ncbi:MAG: glycyl-radical enzyme activating protein [Spirochaetes bacterium]|nr:glycyl-radical enzyme activating protein [Spirochaetota bacterium]
MKHTKEGEPYGLVTNIQKYTIHDGPGIRTEIFFKGCPLRCLWCSNPEGLSHSRQLGVYPSKCIGFSKCSFCINVCPEGKDTPIIYRNDILVNINENLACDDCFKCADECPSRAIMIWGDKMTVPDLMKIILEDRNFYLKTGGGVTLSGGEVMLQWDFVLLLLKACKDAAIHTCIESSLYCPPDHLEKVYEFTDLVITDIKHMDSGKHKEYTGVGNELILSNIKKTVELNKPLVIRIPVVPEHNNNEENIRATAKFIIDELGNNIVRLQLLPFRKMGTEKYATLCLPYPMEEFNAPEREVWEKDLLHLTDILKEYGIPAVAGSSGKML